MRKANNIKKTKMSRKTRKNKKTKNTKRYKKTKNTRQTGGEAVNSTLFKNIITEAFKQIALENSWTNYEKDAEDYLNYLKNLEIESTPTIGGGLDFNKYLKAVLGMVIGRFDTPCDRILSNLTFVLYCITITTLVKSYNKHGNINDAMADEEYAHSLADPVQYAFYYNFRAIYNFQEQLFSVFRDYLQKALSMIQVPAGISASSLTALIRAAIYNRQLYNTFIVKPISCILKPVIVSCEENCQ